MFRSCAVATSIMARSFRGEDYGFPWQRQEKSTEKSSAGAKIPPQQARRVAIAAGYQTPAVVRMDRWPQAASGLA
jgi:hypothetical protein